MLERGLEILWDSFVVLAVKTVLAADSMVYLGEKACYKIGKESVILGIVFSISLLKTFS